MEKDNKLGKNLLKQNGIEPGKVSDEDLKKIHREVTKERSRVKRMKWIILVVLAIWLGSYIICAIMEISTGRDIVSSRHGSVFFPIVYIGFYLLLLCVAIYFLHKYLLSTKTNSANQAEIQKHLANIEERLRELNKKD